MRFGPRLVSDLVHWQNDSFEASFAPGSDRWFLKFGPNEDGQVDRVEVERWEIGSTLPTFRRVSKDDRPPD
jgi:hypothetical protein